MRRFQYQVAEGYSFRPASELLHCLTPLEGSEPHGRVDARPILESAVQHGSHVSFLWHLRLRPSASQSSNLDYVVVLHHDLPVVLQHGRQERSNVGFHTLTRHMAW